mgnify:CR=1 FL=1
MTFSIYSASIPVFKQILGSLAAILDPACVVLGGGVAEQPGLLPRLRKALARPDLAGHLPSWVKPAIMTSKDLS